MLQIYLETQLRKGFQNPHLAFYPKQMDTVNWKSELNLELFGSFFSYRVGAGVFQLHFFSRAEAGAFRLYFIYSELELEPESSGGKIGVGSKSEPIVHLWVTPPPQWANSGGKVSITSLKSITSANTPQNYHKTYHHQPLIHHHQLLNHQHHHKNHNHGNNCPESFNMELSWLLEGLESSS